MIAARSFFIFVPTWNLSKQVFIENNNTWAPVKRAFIKSGGAWNQVYSENTFGSVGSQHPYWQYSLDSEFRVNDNNQNDGLATDLFYTFWSTNNSGTYAINQGSARVNINDVTRTVIPGSPGTPGSYNYTTETRSIFCNFTNGSNSVVTFSNPGVSPVNRTGVDGVSVPWNIQAFGYTRSGTTIQSIASDNGTVQTFIMSRTAQATDSGITANLSRTYASSYNPPTDPTPDQYNYYGICRMLSNYELRVSGGQTYRLSTSVVGGNVGGNNRWGINAYTSNTSGQAAPFGSGSQSFQSSTYGSESAQTFDVTIPSGHLYLRVGTFVEYNATSETDSPPSLPRWARFDYLRVSRI